MPRIFDNISDKLLKALQDTLPLSHRADFCVGYFNLRGWKYLETHIEHWAPQSEQTCRLLIGMQATPEDMLRAELSISETDQTMTQQMAAKLKAKLAARFRDQLVIGVPNNDDEKALRCLAEKLKDKRVTVKLYLRHSLHAKLYLIHRHDAVNPIIGYLGSSNLTLSGLAYQGELNVDVLDHDAATKLAKWFEDRWNDKFCVDISNELLQIIEESWAREEARLPYHIYLKMAYHLSQEARSGLTDYRIPRDFGNKLFDFQTAAVKIAAHHLNKRGGVMVGDVVGLGKTIMAVAIARIFEDDFDLETLIICPKNLVPMWNWYCHEYRMRARILPISTAIQQLPKLRRYRVVIIDESHNLRNREGKRFRAIQSYIQENESKVILLTATPYNKTYLDLSSQLRLFLPEDMDLGIRPETLLSEMGETEFIRQHQCSVRSLAAFEKSAHPDDWRELMRLYLIRRTRSFIQSNYAEYDPERDRRYLVFPDGSRSYFPTRAPKTLKFANEANDTKDIYARLYSDGVVSTINGLFLPRYGMGNYISPKAKANATEAETKQIQDLSRAGKILMGFCRTNLFKRLESSGYSFLLSIERHILRNYIFLYAIENGLPLPIGSQGAEMLDDRFYDGDADRQSVVGNLFEDDDDSSTEVESATEMSCELYSEAYFMERAKKVYGEYSGQYKRRFSWIQTKLFAPKLKKHLQDDIVALSSVLEHCKSWNPGSDEKLNELEHLIQQKHRHEKILVFTQFADTALYVTQQLKKRGVTKIAAVTGDSQDPTELAWRFSPKSNGKSTGPDAIDKDQELRILIATDVLSEGQNLQDAHIVVNYDLPWAIIRLIQRAGRVDRIGQESDNILCYSFLPADGVEKIIKLRSRVQDRLKQNAEVVGTDEAFFEDEDSQSVLNLYNEEAGILDGEADEEVDLASYAYQIWKQAIEQDKSLEKTIPALPSVVFSAKKATTDQQGGALVYMRTAEGADALAWVDKAGKILTQSQYSIIRAAACEPSEPPALKATNHHELVKIGAKHLVFEEKITGGQLGRPSGARFRTYERLLKHIEELKGTLFEGDVVSLKPVIDGIYRYPLRPSANDTLNRQLRSGISNDQLAEICLSLWQEERLCQVQEDDSEKREPQLICSLGLVNAGGGA